MKEKKSAIITFRTEEWIKTELEKAAEINKWSLAQTVEEICKKFICNPHPDRIIIKTKDLAKIVGECLRENREGATQINIDLETDEENQKVYKVLNFLVLECGGLGCISDFDNIKEMTKEEILEIP